MPDAFAIVNVGNSECGFLKLTPLSRTSAMAGAVSGVTFNARKPSGMNRIRLWGVPFCANAAPEESIVRPAASNMMERRIKSPLRSFRPVGRRLGLVLLYDRFVTVVRGRLPGNYTPSETPPPGHLPQSKTSDRAW